MDWRRVPDPGARYEPTRKQVPGATRFARAEGIWWDRGIVYIATTGDNRLHRYSTRTGKLGIVYDAGRLDRPLLTGVDNITVSRSGDLYVCEDNGGRDPFDIALITPAPDRRVGRFLKLTGAEHGYPGTDFSSEVTGVVFDPAGERMYFASQRAYGTGVVYEVRGPFRRRP